LLFILFVVGLHMSDKEQNNLSVEDMVFIINHLTSSLSILFGANYLGNPTSNTPQLKNLLDIHRSNHRSKSSITLDRIVYRGFCDLLNCFDAVSRHHDQSKRPKVLALTKLTIERLLETTNRIYNITFRFPISICRNNLKLEVAGVEPAS